MFLLPRISGERKQQPVCPLPSIALHPAAVRCDMVLVTPYIWEWHVYWQGSLQKAWINTNSCRKAQRTSTNAQVLPPELHQAFSTTHVRNNCIWGEVWRGVTSGVSRETSTTMDVTPHLHRVRKTTYTDLISASDTLISDKWLTSNGCANMFRSFG